MTGQKGLLLWGIILFPLAAKAQVTALNPRVLVVYNANVPESRRVAEYYVRKRGIPAANVCRIKPPLSWSLSGTVSVPWDDFEDAIRKPIRRCLDSVGRKEILYIVFSYHTPYKLSSAPARYGISLDQYIEDIWDEGGTSSPTWNPYYAGAESRAGRYPPFLPLADYRKELGAKIVYSVWRLDAATPSLAMGLVDKAIEAEREGLSGQGCIDRRFGKDMNAIEDTGYGSGDWDLYRAGQFLRQAGIPVTEDAEGAEFGTAPAPLRCDGAIFYAGWYSLNHYNDAFKWNPGAIGFHLDSASAADPRGGTNWSANALKKGITVTSGAIDEPTLEGLPHPGGTIHDLLAGANVGDALLRNTRLLKWMILNIGDPLYHPSFSKRPSRQAKMK